MTTGYPSNAPNFYPMSQTFGYFSTDGVNWSAPTVLMRESTYQSLGWVQSSFNGAAFSPLHLWAPSAQQGSDGNWYLYVPDLNADGTYHLTYGGVLMCGSGSTEFTDQGSIMPSRRTVPAATRR